MTVDLFSGHTTVAAERARPAGSFTPDWSERVVTAVAAALALTIVAVVVVLMGMA
jgi:hypothetical protein